MAAITKVYNNIADASLDPDAPLLSSLMYALRDNIVHTHEWLGASYSAGAVQDHNHDGSNSAALENGPNLLRNGSFESDLVGWTQTPYTGGTIAASAVQFAHGKKSAGITSTVLANGGGDLLSAGFIEVSQLERYPWSAHVWASVANVSSKLEAVWYTNALALVSTQILFSYTNTPIAITQRAGSVTPPATARYVRYRATGGVPASGAAVGTVWFDGIKHGDFGQVGALGNVVVITASGTYTKPDGLKALRVRQVGGGGGGGSGGSGGSGGGGGGGGYGEKLIQADAVGATETVTVGAAGAAGGAGGTSSFGAHCSSTGGSAGANGTASLHGSGGAGGGGSGGTIICNGSIGTTGTVAATSGGGGGAGGSSILGGGGGGQYGAGGGGGPLGGGGGTAGRIGVVIVEEYF